MEKMIKIINKKQKKGFIFTISTLFLLLALISLVSIANKTTKIEKDIALERVNELGNSVSNNILDLFFSYSDVNVTIITKPSGKTDVIITESISRNKTEWGAEFARVMENFKTFVETHDEFIKINMTDINDKEIPIVIIPHNITYTRDWGPGHVELTVEPEQTDPMNFESYEITIDSGDTEINSVSSTFRDAGDFLFKVRAKDNFGNDITKEALVDPLDNHLVQVFFVGGNKVKIDLVNGILTTWTNQETDVLVETKMGNLTEGDTKVKITLYDAIVSVDLPNLDVSKTSDVSIGQE